MAEALVSGILKQLGSITAQEIEQEIRLVVGVKEEVRKLESKLQTLQAVLDDAEKRQVKEKAVKLWLDQLKDASYGMDDLLDEWNTALIKSEIEKEEKITENASLIRKKVRSLTSSLLCFGGVSEIVHRRDIAQKLKSITERLDEIGEEEKTYNFTCLREFKVPEHQLTTSFVDVSEVYGRDKDKETIVNRLLCESTQGRGLHIISVLGFGGLGKTTLAQLAYNEIRVENHFEKRIWVCVSDPFDTIRVAKAINESLTGTKENLDELENVLQHLRISIEGKKFLLVLDDVWTENYKDWEPLKHCLKYGEPGSKILVTTRKEGVATMMAATHTIHLGRLSDENSWSLFSQLAFYERSDKECENQEELGRKIVDKCKGLPLAVKTLGSHLRFKKRKEQWQNVLDSTLWELEDVERGLFAPLLFSYYDLPSALKRCFSYCAIFPKDEILSVDKLIKLWMAQGYLDSKESMDIEMIGQEYFENLAMRSFFQDFKKSEDDGRIISCKMHDIVHDFAQLLMENECFEMVVDETKELGTKSFSKMVRHLTLCFGEQMEVPAVVCKAKNLRTLYTGVDRGSICKTILPDLFCHLTCLRVLDLSSQSIEEVPQELGSLIHLRYLDLSSNLALKELPETICNLCNLQTLDLSFSRSLEKLPQGIGKLINLRHLIFDGVFYFRKSFPKGFGRLSSLRSLKYFVVGANDDSEGCKLGELKNLNHLQGDLKVQGLGNLIEVHEAENAQLKKKVHLLILSLYFDGEKGTENRRIENDERLLNALEPHLDLECLEINWYHGTIMFPNWLMSIKLKKLCLIGCNKLGCLPPLGRLPFLESLKIRKAESVKKVGVEFLGIQSKDKKKDEGLTTSSSLIFFPNLKSLEFWSLEEWEEWDGSGGMREEEKKDGVIIMPHLNSLKIYDCPKLKALPHFLQKTPLQKLDIHTCRILSQRCEKGSGEDWPKVSHIPNIDIW